MNKFNIEDGVKSTNHPRGTPPKYPFNKMKIEQSFWVPQSEDSSGSRLRSAASAYSRRHREFRFSVSASTNGDRPGWRVWRVEALSYPMGFSKSDVAEMEVARKAVVTAPTTDEDDNGQAEYERDMAASLSELRAETPGTSEASK